MKITMTDYGKETLTAYTFNTLIVIGCILMLVLVLSFAVGGLSIASSLIQHHTVYCTTYREAFVYYSHYLTLIELACATLWLVYTLTKFLYENVRITK